MTPLNAIVNPSEPQILFRQGIEESQSAILTEIYQEDSNIVIWKRSLASSLTLAADAIVDTMPSLEKLLVLSSQDTYSKVEKALGSSPAAAVLSEDIAQLVDMFCCLFVNWEHLFHNFVFDSKKHLSPVLIQRNWI